MLLEARALVLKRSGCACIFTYIEVLKRPPAPSPLRFRFASASALASASAVDDLWGVERLSRSALPLLEARALHERGRRRSRSPAPSPLGSRFACTASALDDLRRVRCLSRPPAPSLPSCSSALVARARVLLALRLRLALPSLRSASLSSSWSCAWTRGGSKCTPECGSACWPPRPAICSATVWILPMIATSDWRLVSACDRAFSKLWNSPVTERTQSLSAADLTMDMVYRGRKLGIARSQDS